MTSKKQTPREWEIKSTPIDLQDELPNDCGHWIYGPWTERVEVVEKSAYEAAQAEAEKYKALAEGLREALDFNYEYYAAKQHKLIDLAKDLKLAREVYDAATKESK